MPIGRNSLPCVNNSNILAKLFVRKMGIKRDFKMQSLLVKSNESLQVIEIQKIV